MKQMSTCICQVRPLTLCSVDMGALRFKRRNGYLKSVTFTPASFQRIFDSDQFLRKIGYLKSVTFPPASFQRISTRTSFCGEMTTLSRSPLLPPLFSVFRLGPVSGLSANTPFCLSPLY